jgi:DivIVA domain-containing protein
VDGDTTESTETERTEGTEPDAVDEPTEEQATAEPEDRITCEQLVSYLRRAHFDGTRGRRGYHRGEVNAFLLRLIEAVEAGEPLADPVRRTHFTPVRLEDGYEPAQVDDFLKAVVDVDPNAGAARPELARSGLVSKLFG